MYLVLLTSNAVSVCYKHVQWFGSNFFLECLSYLAIAHLTCISISLCLTPFYVFAPVLNVCHCEIYNSSHANHFKIYSKHHRVSFTAGYSVSCQTEYGPEVVISRHLTSWYSSHLRPNFYFQWCNLSGHFSEPCCST